MSQTSRLMAQATALLVVAGGLGLYAYFGIFKKDQAEAVKRAADQQLFAATPSNEPTADAGAMKLEFTKLTVTAKGENTVLERAPGAAWQLIYPTKAAADALVLDALVSQLQQAKIKATLEENPSADDLKMYGLTPPEFSVEATALAGGVEKTVVLRGGIENPFDGSIYLQRDAAKAVYLAEGGVRYALAKSTFDLRAKGVLLAEDSAIRAVTVKTKLNAYTLRHEGDAWALTQPITLPADGPNVASMLGALRGEKVQAFLPDSPEARRAAGLDSPRVDATVELARGETIRLRLAPAVGDAGGVAHLLREDANGATLAEVQPSALNHLDRNPADLRDKSLVVFKKELVAKLVLHNADGSEVVIEKENPDASITDAWRVTAPVRGPAKTFKVTSVLWTLGAIKGSTFVTDTPKAATQYGFDAKARFIALYDAAGAELARFTIGREVPSKPNVFYARGTQPSVLELDGARLAELPTRADEVLDSTPSAVDAGR